MAIKNLNKKFFNRVLFVVMLAMFLWYFFFHLQDFRILLNINIGLLIVATLVYVGSLISNGLFMQYSVSLFDKKINLNEGIKVALISTIGNFFAPAGSGLAFRAIYLKKRHSLTYSQYTSIVLCNYIIVFIFNSLLGILSLLILKGNGISSGHLLTIFFTVVLILSISSFFIRSDILNNIRVKTKWLSYITSILRQISDGWTLILHNKKRVFKLVGITLLNGLLMIAGSYLIISSLGITLSLSGLVLFSVLGSMSLFINITPGNFGIKESVYAVFSSIIGLSVPQVVSISLIDRLINFLVIFFFWLLFGKNSSSPIDKINKNHY